MKKIKQKKISNFFFARGVLYFVFIFLFFIYIPKTLAASYVLSPTPLEIFNSSQVVLKMPENDQALETADALQALNLNDAFPLLHPSRYPALCKKNILQPIISFSERMKMIVQQNEISARLIDRKIALTRINFTKVSVLASIIKTNISASVKNYNNHVVKPVVSFKRAVLLVIGTSLFNTGHKISLAYNNYFSPNKICVDGECLTKDDIHNLLILAHSTQKNSEALATPIATQ